MVKALKKWLRPAYVRILSMLPFRARVMLGYVLNHGRLPDIRNPKTFNEKIIWRKLYDRDPRLPELVDKIRVKEWIAARYGSDPIIPTLAVYDSPAEMDFTKPPLSTPPYVIKTNHGCGTNIYIKSAADLADEKDIRDKLAVDLRHNHGAVRGEWAYEGVRPRILIEPYIETPEGYLADYKFYVCDGRTFMVEQIFDRYGDYRIAYCDRDWNRLDIDWSFPVYPLSSPLPKPALYDAMLKFAEDIGRDFSFIRVDLYDVGGVVKLGELTFYPGAGHDKFTPRSWDDRFGALWKLPSVGNA